MDASSPAATGWPFLVAAGRRRDYSILLAPEFLVAGLDYGVLETVVRPGSDTDPATVLDVRTPGGHRLTVVSATHLLTGTDLGEPNQNPHDEHGRPLRLIYGFTCRDAWISEPAGADLSFARSTALDTYRRFLVDEERAAVTPSQPFPLRSAATIRRPPRPTIPAAANGGTDTPRRYRAARWVAVAAAVAGFAVAGVVALGLSKPSSGPAPCPSASASRLPAGTAPAASPSPTCTPISGHAR